MRGSLRLSDGRSVSCALLTRVGLREAMGNGRQGGCSTEVVLFVRARAVWLKEGLGDLRPVLSEL